MTLRQFIQQVCSVRLGRSIFRRRWLVLLIGFCLLWLLTSTSGVVYAAADQPIPGNPVWSDVGEANITTQGKREIVPNHYRALRLDVDALQAQLQQAPREGSTAARSTTFLFSLPLPDGAFARFHLVESPIMAPALAAQFPTIKTYAGQGIDDPTATVRLDWTPAGLHAMILSATDTIFIDPYQRGDIDHYISYFKRDFQLPAAKIFIEPAPTVADTAMAREIAALVASGVLKPSGAQLRTYRLAVAATGEYTQFHGGTVAQGLAAIVTTMNRINGIYEREVAVRMTLVANNNLLVYTNSATDPYSNGNASALLNENQTNIDNVIGNANYDVGHVFSTGGGGLAALGVPCVTGLKAQGETGSSAPVGDPFDVDYVAHEIGHQFGANHTFNGTAVFCAGGNRNGSTAYEPGSGSTIMAYAGICGAQNLQSNSDAYFHTISFDEIVAYTTVGAGNSCAVTTNTGNAAPVPAAGASYTIPGQTPFTLTGSATDANNDALTYNWEEFDLGTAGAPNNPNIPPFFRSFTATSSPARTFPQWSDIINNTTTIGEILPNTTRTMTFRLTVRDNRLGGGGVNHASTKVNVTTAAGPFQVTEPNTAVSWNGGAPQNVTWNVVNTNVAPINCTNVNLLLSTDGGLTYPTAVAAGVPNNGLATVTVPNLASTTARIQVACAGNIFFDISNANFTIVPDLTIPTVVNVTASTANGVYKTGDVIDIQLLFSENMVVAGTPQLTLETGAIDAVIDYLSGSGSNTLTFRYTVAAGQISADLDYISSSALSLNGASIQDSAGNNAILTLPVPGAAGSLGANKALVIDAVAPDTTITSSPLISTSVVSASFSFTGDDVGSGVAGFACQLDGSGFSACTTPLTIDSLSDGEHTFQVRALDAVGNVDPTPASFTWIVDATAPDTIIISAPLTITAITTASFAFSGDDGNGVGVAGFDCSLDGDPFAACADHVTYPDLSDGSHTFAVRSFDALGHVDPTPAGFAWMVDTLPPQTTITGNPTDPSNGSASFSFGSNEEPSTFECQLDSGNFSTCISPLSLTNLSEGNHAFAVRAIDRAGNRDSTPTSYTWRVDTTPPDTTITGAPAPQMSSPNISFSGSDGESGVAGFACQLDNGGFDTCSSPQSYRGLSEGAHTFAVRAIDAVGNIDPTPASLVWTIDASAPTVTFGEANGQGDGTNISPIHFTVIFGEPVTGFGDSPDDVLISGTASRGATATVTDDAPNDGTTYNVAVSGMAMDGTVMISIPAGAATDLAGNPNTGSVNPSKSVVFDFTEAGQSLFLPVIIR